MYRTVYGPMRLVTPRFMAMPCRFALLTGGPSEDGAEPRAGSTIEMVPWPRMLRPIDRRHCTCVMEAAPAQCAPVARQLYSLSPY